MSLPFWAAAPGNRYHHDDNYSPLEVVWTDTDTGDVQIQTENGYIDLADDVMGLGPSTDQNLAISVLDSNLRLAPLVRSLERRAATRVQLVCFSCAAALVGALGGMLGAHVWHP